MRGDGRLQLVGAADKVRRRRIRRRVVDLADDVVVGARAGDGFLLS